MTNLIQEFEIDLAPGEIERVEVDFIPTFWHIYPRGTIGADGVRFANGPMIPSQGAKEIQGLMEILYPGLDRILTLQNNSGAVVHLFITALRGFHISVNAAAEAAMSSASFLGLTDTPGEYAGQANKRASVKASEDGLEFTPEPSHVFPDLTDTPASYVGEAGKRASVKATEDGLEFTPEPSHAFPDLTDTPASYIGEAGKITKVKATEDGLEFMTHDKTVHDALGIDAASVDGFDGHAPTKAAHDSLGIDADTVDGFHGHDGTKAAHDALNIDADTVDGSHASAFAAAGHTHALGDLSNVSATGEGSGGGFDADTVDGKHWDSMKYGGGSLLVGNKDAVLASGERAAMEVPYACTLKELKARELEALSGSATLTLYYYSSVGDNTVDWSEDISLTSQWNRSRTGLSRSMAKGGWLVLVVSGTPSTVKRVAVAVGVERT